MAEIKQNEIEGLVAYLEQVPRYSLIAKSFLRYPAQFHYFRFFQVPVISSPCKLLPNIVQGCEK